VNFGFERDPTRGTGTLRVRVAGITDNGNGHRPALFNSIGVLGFNPMPLDVDGGNVDDDDDDDDDGDGDGGTGGTIGGQTEAPDQGPVVDRDD